MDQRSRQIRASGAPGLFEERKDFPTSETRAQHAHGAEISRTQAESWCDPPAFSDALRLQLSRHGESISHLQRALVQQGHLTKHATILKWVSGEKLPRTAASLLTLAAIESRYDLPRDYFKAKLPNSDRAVSCFKYLTGFTASERAWITWHLPDDFDQRSERERAEILQWVRNVMLPGGTEFRRFQATASKHRYALLFPMLIDARAKRLVNDNPDVVYVRAYKTARRHSSRSKVAPPELAREVSELVRFKTATLTDAGLRREGVWNAQTAMQRIGHIGLLFGALGASPKHAVNGFGAPRGALAMGLLVFPTVWDWYVQWRERRRGFYTRWEVDMVQFGLALTRNATGWIRQHPNLAERLQPISGLVTQQQIDVARADWEAACDNLFAHGSKRAKEIQRIVRVHRDPFEAIMPILKADSPVGMYRLITKEIVKRMPDERHYPRAAAEAVRSFLLLRFGLHLGLRQKNLRELLFCRRGNIPETERQLELKRRGELRWNEARNGWEVLVPASAFKNSASSFFRCRPFLLVLPDVDGLYAMIEMYLDVHRSSLLNGVQDPGTLFVKTTKTTTRNAAFDQNSFYQAWRSIIQRYGIKNPYTGRGAIEGLLPHGPHNVRDVLATHVLKQTGSYTQASYAIQDTPATVQKHYGRFHPEDKLASAAQILNRAWEVELATVSSGYPQA
ncbi:hypothetical protein HNO88_004383 [Novosphingobium chloroacetimidivorans]|uniref:Uncharacterized protein n=1 Tax=Novosphingobium chloroacetimidivorans TaxID=1428314 RepID=A0A7W7NZ92_9SPHN|nr:hypothetical protein [Novosphingobium chloroacetimidivorans]MBB4861035.1 hypothetical protein [Novosphingobium chloroacetimidivorans]